tara:strand:- start:2069 stop:2317 length:249 start_codon:yes stop_codon:yes gene_type:complete
MPRKKKVVEPVVPKSVVEDWTCHCGAKLGEKKEDTLYIKYSSLRVQTTLVTGHVSVVCPKCGWVKNWLQEDGKISVEMPETV